MKILILSFYYTPDLCAGSFRTAALINALLEKLPEKYSIELITTLPNRYHSYTSHALEYEESTRITIRRIQLPKHKSGMLDQAKAFYVYAKKVLHFTRNSNYSLIYGTSSRLMTAALSALISKKKKIPLYLDIRDIFVDTISDILSKKKLLLIKPVLSMIEHFTMNQAVHINLVSKGFEHYFSTEYPSVDYSFFTNGIDPEFLPDISSCGKPIEDDNLAHLPSCKTSAPLTVLYAGNIGEGQGLDIIIPELAKHFEGRLYFRVIGDGGLRTQLERQLGFFKCTNVEILPPVIREDLIKEYNSADILFLHLNDYNAFKKVLPSKIFEYAAIQKPIWAGVAGYASEFIHSEIDSSVVFLPCNIQDAIRSFDLLNLTPAKRTKFIDQYSRTNIMAALAQDILNHL